MIDLAVFDRAIILTGPTGSGKSSQALHFIERHGGEIISMDSMALYRGMDHGTAKPSQEDLDYAPHHLVNCLDPWQSASVAWWLGEAARITQDILDRGKLPIIVGGTPLYLKALMCGLFEGPAIDPHLRTTLESLSTEELYQQLLPVDPVAAIRIHPHDHRRLVRALEVYRQTGQTLSSLQREFAMPPRQRPFPILCLDVPRATLYQRIDARVDSMMQAGWLDEVKQLMALPQPLSREAIQAAGYRELMAHLKGECSLEEAVTATKTRTRQLAKRQLTWFRHFPGLEMVTPQAFEVKVSHYISSITPAIGSAGSPL